MADLFEKVEVIWSEDQTRAVGFIVDGLPMSRTEFRDRNAFIAVEMSNDMRLKVLENFSPSSDENAFHTLLEIIKTRIKLIHKNHC